MRTLRIFPANFAIIRSGKGREKFLAASRYATKAAVFSVRKSVVPFRRERFAEQRAAEQWRAKDCAAPLASVFGTVIRPRAMSAATDCCIASRLENRGLYPRRWRLFSIEMQELRMICPQEEWASLSARRSFHRSKGSKESRGSCPNQRYIASA